MQGFGRAEEYASCDEYRPIEGAMPDAAERRHVVATSVGHGDARITRVGALVAAVLFLVTATTAVADPIPADNVSHPATIDGNPGASSSSDDVAPLTCHALPAGTVFNHVVVGGTDTDGVVAGVAEKLIYSNTRGRFIIPLPAFFLVADDIATIAPDGCALRRFSFQVTGDANLSGTETRPYNVTYAMYDTCPESVPADALSTRLVPGTDGQITLTDVALTTVEIDLSTANVVIPTSLWLAITFYRDNCGIIGGAPALEGFSGDLVSYPELGCSLNLGGFPLAPHGSFNVEIFGDSGSCPDKHLAYRNTREEGDPLNLGAGSVVVDDLTLLEGAGTCLLTGYEVAVKGSAVYDIELRNACPGDPPDQEWFPDGTSVAIPGTYNRQIISTSADTGTHIIRIPVDPPVLISGTVSLAIKVDTTTGGPILTGTQARIGSTSRDLEKIDADGGCFQAPIASSVKGALQATLICDGPADPGACCDMFFKECTEGADDGELCSDNTECAPPGTCESVCREVPQVNCPRVPNDPDFLPAWAEGEVCDPDPFPFTCGAAACCVLDEGCENLTENQCFSKEPLEVTHIWQQGRYCGEGDQHCPLGQCAVARSGPGCWDEECERFVCSVDSWCCDVEWDELCIRNYEQLCESVPLNAKCYVTASGLLQPRSIGADSTTVISNAFARTGSHPAGFSCFEGTERRCVGGNFDGQLCHDDSDCNHSGEGTCEDLVVAPERQGIGVLWFRFTATETSAHIDTCQTAAPVSDTVIQVYSALDNSSNDLACETLVGMGCNDNMSLCTKSPLLAGLCVSGLMIGETYYVKLAGVSDTDKGIIVLNVESPCPDGEIRPPTPSPILSALASVDDLSPSKSHSLTLVDSRRDGKNDKLVWDQKEVPYDPPAAKPIDRPVAVVSNSGRVERNGFVSVQVNVDEFGNNIVGDAANEPSIAVDSSNPSRIVIGWRQFDTIASNFRQAGWGYSHDGGRTWTFPGVLEPNVFRSDPVLCASSEGTFYYYSLNGGLRYDLFTSFDGGVTWPRSVPAFGGDKGWMIVDTTGGPGQGNIYAQWFGNRNFGRSVDGGASFVDPVDGVMQRGTLAVGLDGEVYSVSYNGSVSVSRNAWNSHETPVFHSLRIVGSVAVSTGFSPNPGGLIGQGWIAVDHSDFSTRGNIYVLTTGSISGGGPDAVFSRSTDGGSNWSDPIRVNDDASDSTALQWFGTMSVAPNGRIDVVWNDTRNSGHVNLSELYYSSSEDGGRTWSKNIPLSPVFDSYVGFPNQNKIGDYYHMVSDNQGASIAYAATFNGEQDVYYLRIGPPANDCNENGFPDRDDVVKGRSLDCDGDFFPDECERDFDGDGLIDNCDPDKDNDGIDNEFDVCNRTGIGVVVTEDGRPRGDTTRDCDLNLSDFWRFRNCMVGGRSGVPAPQEACLGAFDFDTDGELSLRDFAVFQNGFMASRR